VVFELVLVLLYLLGGLVDLLFNFLCIIQESFLRPLKIFYFDMQFLFVKSQLLVCLLKIVVLFVYILKLIRHFGKVFNDFSIIRLKYKLRVFALSNSLLPRSFVLVQLFLFLQELDNLLLKVINSLQDAFVVFLKPNRVVFFL
jgi:hypothetical protein